MIFKIFFFIFQHYHRPANNGSSSGAPPPYPGRGGPGHGYGEGRGHYNRASSHPAEFHQHSRGGASAPIQASNQNQAGPSRGGRSSNKNRHSRMEMQPMRWTFYHFLCDIPTWLLLLFFCFVPVSRCIFFIKSKIHSENLWAFLGIVF